MNAYKAGVSSQLPGQPEERLLKVVVRLGRNIVVLQVLLSVECDCLGLDFSLLHIDLVTAENDWDVLADTDEITMPVRDVLVCDTRGDVKHDDTALSVDVVSITETTELLLTCSIPDIELDRAKVRCETERVNFDTEGSDVLFLEFTSQMALDKRGLSSSNMSVLSEGDVFCSIDGKISSSLLNMSLLMLPISR
jgi:hypothetical protein